MLSVAAGALLYAPDSLMLRLMAMDQWPTVFWRGLLSGTVVTLAYFLIYRGRFPSMLTGMGWATASTRTATAGAPRPARTAGSC